MEEYTTNIEDQIIREISEQLDNPPRFEDINTLQHDGENRNIGSVEIPLCYSCAEEKRFESGRDVTQGTHIVLGKYFPIDIFNEYINDLVKKASDFFSREQGFIYYHHSIVSEVVETSEFTAKVKLIEFKSVGSLEFKVVETDKDIDVRDENIFYKHYIFPRYKPEEIVKRAKQFIGKKISYELLSNNCENVAVWCITDEHESFQSSSAVDKGLRQIVSWIGTIVGKVIEYYNVFDDMVSGLRVIKGFAKTASVTFSCLPIAGIFFLIELVVSALRLEQLKIQKQRGLICTACYNEKRILLISKIVCSFFATTVLAAIPASGKILVTFATVAVGFAAIYILPRLCCYLYREVKCLINPLYKEPKMVVRKSEQISPGCVLTTTNDHYILIKRVTRVGETTKYVGLNIVHFQYRGVLGTRTVFNERFYFELKRNLLQVLDVPEHEAYADDEVVKKALEKAEKREQAFNAFVYRSSHMAKHCKVRDYNISKGVILTKRDVQTGSDVKAGDMVNFRYCKLPHVGIVVGKSFDDIVNLEFYHVVNGTVQLETKELDLGSGGIQKLIYPIGDVQRIMENAERQQGQSVYGWKPCKSSRFVKSCITPEQ